MLPPDSVRPVFRRDTEKSRPGENSLIRAHLGDELYSPVARAASNSRAHALKNAHACVWISRLKEESGRKRAVIPQNLVRLPRTRREISS
jgi:hypothetical protein